MVCLPWVVRITENREKVDAVRRMQDYIMAHYQEEITLRDLANAARYSPWHALRAFSELVGKTPFEYLRTVRLSEAAKKLRDTEKSVLDIALESAFGSHEGFTKAFSQKFAMSPREYRVKTPPIPLFSYYPVQHRHKLPKEREETMQSTVVFTQVIERPERKLILKRGVNATEYFAYCKEVGCDIWGILESIKGALHESIGVWLPEKMRKPGTSEYCQGVEVPADFAGEIPEGFDIIDLPACKYMVFHSEPFEDEEFEEAIHTVWEAIKRYNPNHFAGIGRRKTAPGFSYLRSARAAISRGFLYGS